MILIFKTQTTTRFKRYSLVFLQSLWLCFNFVGIVPYVSLVLLIQGEAYYKSLGYKSLMEGVIAEAEKEGRGDEVRERIDEFNKQSKLKGLATITFFIIAFFFYKASYVPDIPPSY